VNGGITIGNLQRILSDVIRKTPSQGRLFCERELGGSLGKRSKKPTQMTFRLLELFLSSVAFNHFAPELRDERGKEPPIAESQDAQEQIDSLV
jgi:hypothetical protein